MQHQKILILDFGSQVTQLIARRIREAHVYCEVHPCDVSDDWVRQYAADGALKVVILSGSHASVYEDTTDKAPEAVFIDTVGLETVQQRNLELAERLSGILRKAGYEVLRDRFGHDQTAIVCARRDGDMAELHATLTKKGVVSALREGYLRFSPHLNVAEGDLERFEQKISPTA